MMKILDAKFEKAKLDAYLNLSSHLDTSQKSNLKSLLLKYEPLLEDRPNRFVIKIRRGAFSRISFSMLECLFTLKL